MYLGFCRPDLIIDNTIGKEMYSSATTVETTAVRRGLEVEKGLILLMLEKPALPILMEV